MGTNICMICRHGGAEEYFNKYFFHLLRLDSLIFFSHLLSAQFLVLGDLLNMLTFTGNLRRENKKKMVLCQEGQ